MSKLSDFDISELIQQLNGEMELALVNAQKDSAATKLQLEELTTRLGQNFNREDSSEELVPLLNPKRYPNEENWEVELNYKYSDLKNRSSLVHYFDDSGNDRLVFDRLSNLPITDIKGAEIVWGRILGQYGIKTIFDLSECKEDLLLKICRQQTSNLPWELQTKVLLLIRKFKPLTYQKFANKPLLLLLEHTQAELKKIFEGKLSGPEIDELRTMVMVINLVIDKERVSELSLAVLMK